jgi:hypothetical protein
VLLEIEEGMKLFEQGRVVLLPILVGRYEGPAGDQLLRKFSQYNKFNHCNYVHATSGLRVSDTMSHFFKLQGMQMDPKAMNSTIRDVFEFVQKRVSRSVARPSSALQLQQQQLQQHIVPPLPSRPASAAAKPIPASTSRPLTASSPTRYKLAKTISQLSPDHSAVEVVESPQAIAFQIINRSPGSPTVDVFISNFSGGSDKWYPIAQNQGDTWKRAAHHYEFVVFRCPDTGKRVGFYTSAGKQVTFTGFKSNHDMDQEYPLTHGVFAIEKDPMLRGFKFVNASKETVKVFMTAYTIENGDSCWYEVGPGVEHSWIRNNWEGLGVANMEDIKKAGIYGQSGHKIVFYGL